MSAAGGKAKLVVREIVKIVEVDPIQFGDETLWFRIEVSREPGKKKRFTGRVWRTEHYRILPTFPQRSSNPAKRSNDEIIVDSSFMFEEITGPSVKAVLARILREIEDRFLKGK
jgi:hypothetical protein